MVRIRRSLLHRLMEYLPSMFIQLHSFPAHFKQRSNVLWTVYKTFIWWEELRFIIFFWFDICGLLVLNVDLFSVPMCRQMNWRRSWILWERPASARSPWTRRTLCTNLRERTTARNRNSAPWGAGSNPPSVSGKPTMLWMPTSGRRCESVSPRRQRLLARPNSPTSRTSSSSPRACLSCWTRRFTSTASPLDTGWVSGCYSPVQC